ncbi:MAG: fumarylacetoacetate hydrolase family protein [Janthinobacterium lividum]
MKLCRFNVDRLGLVEGDAVFDVSAALQALPQATWPVPLGDPLLLHLDALRAAVVACRPHARRFAVAEVTLHSPLTSPSKVMAAPANYRAHFQDTMDAAVDAGVHRKALEGVERPVETYGLFLKATSSIVGAAEGVQIVFPERRTDFEVELAVVIGKRGRGIARADAMQYVAGYCVGLDMTVRGAEERSFRKSPDSYTVLGPHLVTADEIADPHALTLSLWLNGERRQHSSTGAMTVDIPDLIEFASRIYTLYPGDVILTGTPEGVGAVKPGDVIRAGCEGVGEMSLQVSAAASTTVSTTTAA